MPRDEDWSAVALRSCLDHLKASTVTEGKRVIVEAAWIDGPEAFCVIYRPPFDPARRTGIRRTSSDAAETDRHRWRLGDLSPGYDLGDSERPDPVTFGMTVADFEIGEPLGQLVHLLRADDMGVGWWGSLGAELPRE